MSAPVCISVINMKGGVGKTTVAALLSRYAARSLDRKVLAIDLDPQANLSQALMGESGYRHFLDDGSPSIVELLNGSQLRGWISPLDRLMGVTEATGMARDTWYHWPNNLQVLPSRFAFSDSLISAVQPDPKRLAKAIAEHFQDKDLVIIDCAPTESILTQAAYHASRYVLIPVRPEFFATIGFPLLKDSLCAFKKANKEHMIEVIGVVINNATYNGGNDGGPEKRRSMKEIRSVSQQNDWRVFSNELGYSRGFPKMMRGDFNYLGNAEGGFWPFANEFFSIPTMNSLRRKTRTRR